MRKVTPITGHVPEPAQTAAKVAHGSLADAALTDGERELLLLQRIVGCTSRTVLLERFFTWASQLGLAEGLDYLAERETVPVRHGDLRHHSASYELILEGVVLGRVSVYRRQRFGEDELLTLERALGSLARGLQGAVEVDTLRDMVTHDPLTGLGNRATLDEWLNREISRTRRHGSPLAVMMIDVDHFKAINDRLGHLGGDRVLRAIAEVLRKSTRRSDLVFRYGGDEFTILMPHTNRNGAAEAARQIRRNLARVDAAELGMGEGPGATSLDISIGIACYQDDDDDESLLQRADTHLYHAKAHGRASTVSTL